ncbi:hypothetical protein VP01_804g1 [Puccinia sorghi]|uniref:Uncharacterized protein n=1 Tax=Puccinia sorghi TaxID=27349 RepID=A0A0L6UAC6_9BASI|nr:hypothetical protein VP01_804g1 [Puccinia sorghi]
MTTILRLVMRKSEFSFSSYLLFILLNFGFCFIVMVSYSQFKTQRLAAPPDSGWRETPTPSQKTIRPNQFPDVKSVTGCNSLQSSVSSEIGLATMARMNLQMASSNTNNTERENDHGMAGLYLIQLQEANSTIYQLDEWISHLRDEGQHTEEKTIMYSLGKNEELRRQVRINGTEIMLNVMSKGMKFELGRIERRKKTRETQVVGIQDENNQLHESITSLLKDLMHQNVQNSNLCNQKLNLQNKIDLMQLKIDMQHPNMMYNSPFCGPPPSFPPGPTGVNSASFNGAFSNVGAFGPYSGEAHGAGFYHSMAIPLNNIQFPRGLTHVCLLEASISLPVTLMYKTFFCLKLVWETSFFCSIYIIDPGQYTHSFLLIIHIVIFFLIIHNMFLLIIHKLILKPTTSQIITSNGEQKNNWRK